MIDPSKSLALTMGDPCGIGPEIVAAQWLSPQPLNAWVAGDPAVMARAVRALAQRHPQAAQLQVVPHAGGLSLIHI